VSAAGALEGGLRRSLRRRHMHMIALGGVIGAGLFVGSGVVIGSAGPAAVISFALTGTLVVLVMRMLGEMAVAYPAIGGFYEYNRLALGELAGFLTGWMYWYFWVIVVALEAVAGARLLITWWPGVPPWQFTLALMSTFTVVNLLSVRSYGEAEFWFASIKVAAIVVFLGAGILFAAGAWPGAHAGLPHLTAVSSRCSPVQSRPPASISAPRSSRSRPRSPLSPSARSPRRRSR
jgi:GABA permease